MAFLSISQRHSSVCRCKKPSRAAADQYDTSFILSLDKYNIMTPSPAKKPPKSPNHDPTSSGHNRGHSFHSTLKSIDCLLRTTPPSSSSSEYSPLVPRGDHRGDAAIASASSYSSPAGGGGGGGGGGGVVGGGWQEKKSSSLPVPNDRTSASLSAPPPSPDDADATADGVAKAATSETKKGDGECDDVAFALRGSSTSALDICLHSHYTFPSPFAPYLPPIVVRENRLRLLRDIRVREFHHVRPLPVRLRRRDLRARRLPAAHQRAQQASHTVERLSSNLLHRFLHPAVRDRAGSGRR